MGAAVVDEFELTGPKKLPIGPPSPVGATPLKLARVALTTIESVDAGWIAGEFGSNLTNGLKMN
jgi:hypothetical protein